MMLSLFPLVTSSFIKYVPGAGNEYSTMEAFVLTATIEPLPSQTNLFAFILHEASQVIGVFTAAVDLSVVKQAVGAFLHATNNETIVNMQSNGFKFFI